MQLVVHYTIRPLVRGIESHCYLWLRDVSHVHKMFVWLSHFLITLNLFKRFLNMYGCITGVLMVILVDSVWNVYCSSKVISWLVQVTIWACLKNKYTYKSICLQGDKEKNITNIHDFQFLLPTLEYHEQRWTWHDLTLVLKNDCKKRLIAQVINFVY